MNKNIILFLDKFGRTVIGEIFEENENDLIIKNPGIINITQDAQSKRFNFQVLPLVLFEIVNVDTTKFYNVKFNKSDISILTTENNNYVEVNSAFVSQYEAMFNALANGLKSNIPETNDNVLEVK